MNNNETTRSLTCSRNRKDYFEKVIEIESRYHEGELSDRLLKYCDLMPFKPTIRKMAEKKGIKCVDSYSVRPVKSEEIEEAVDLYIENMDTDEEELARCFIWALLMPTVLLVYKRTFPKYASHTIYYSDKNGFGDTFINISFQHFCDVLERHVYNILAGKLDGKNRALKELFKRRIRYNATEEFILCEFGQERGFLNRADREFVGAQEEFYWRNGRMPSIEELAKILGVSPETAREHEQRIYSKTRPLFLDEYTHHENSIYETCVYDGKLQNNLVYYDVIEENEINKMVMTLLPEEHRQVVQCIYGFNKKGEPFTLKRTAMTLGMTEHFVKKRIREAHVILRPYLIKYVDDILD